MLAELEQAEMAPKINKALLSRMKTERRNIALGQYFQRKNMIARKKDVDFITFVDANVTIVTPEDVPEENPEPTPPIFREEKQGGAGE